MKSETMAGQEKGSTPAETVAIAVSEEQIEEGERLLFSRAEARVQAALDHRQEIARHLAARYHLNDGDTVNTETGEILRHPAIEPESDAAPVQENQKSEL